ncbi:MAG: mcp1 [Frankiales bacterium]|nr:mcp1 [Frankiales bacterium]
MRFSSRTTDQAHVAAQDDTPLQEALAREQALALQLAEVQATSSKNAERFELMLDAAGIGLWDMDVVAHDPVNPDNEFQWSQEFRTMLGFRDERDFPNILSSWASRLHPEDAGRTVTAFMDHLNDRTGRIPYDIEYRLQLKDGSYRWFVATGATKRDAQGVALRVAGALRDIDDEKRMVEQSDSQLRQLTSSSSQLAGVSSDLANTVAVAVAKAREATSTITQLESSSTQIGAVVKLITGIAAQTNLLALNATIEAARAGDAGRGFAVVANEVKELATETARATSDIARQVTAIREQTDEAVRNIGEIDVAIQALTSTQEAVDELVSSQAR